MRAYITGETSVDSTNQKLCKGAKQTMMGTLEQGYDAPKPFELKGQTFIYNTDILEFHDPWGTPKYYPNDLQLVTCYYGTQRKLLGGCA